MSVISQRATLRWKEWIPLLTQQQRLRNLIQVIAYNIRKGEKPIKCSYYYTLHLTTMSAPFYTSEKIESDNPKWAEVEICEVNGAADGVVIRLWYHNNEGNDEVVKVWGVYFSGLCYLGSRLLLTDPSSFHTNTIIFHMQGGYFTASHCFKEKPPVESRLSSVQIHANDVRPSYSVNLLLRLHTVQQAIKKQTLAAASLRERISAGSLNTAPEQRESAMLRRLLNRSRPKPQRQQMMQVKKEIELVKFRIQQLMQVKNKRLMELRTMGNVKDNCAESNLEKGIELMEQYRCLHRETDRLRELRRLALDNKDILNSTNLKLHNRRRQLIAELNYIYPITQMSGGKYTICGVHLPNSEDFVGVDETMVSVALGFVAHLVQMIAFFLHVPLRYPICHCGSRSKVIDHIIDKLPEKEREFPLFSRSKEKLLFNYGVYLLNKNIAQLRFYCGISTADLRATLSNLLTLLNLKASYNVVGLEAHKRTLSGSSLEMQGSNSPISGLSHLPSSRQCIVKPVGSSTLSFSLDKGLDEINLLKSRKSLFLELSRKNNITHMSSEPALAAGNGKSIDSSEELGKEVHQRVWEYADSVPVSIEEDTDRKQFLERNFSIKKKEKKEEIENLASLIDIMNIKTQVNKSYNRDEFGLISSQMFDSNNKYDKPSVNTNGEEASTENLVFQTGCDSVNSQCNSEVTE